MRDVRGRRKTRRSYDLPGHAHALTFSCYRRRPILSNPLFCEYLGEAIQRAREKLQFSVWVYVFMPEHVHLIVHPEQQDYSVARILQAIKQSVARRAVAHLREHDAGGLRQLAMNSSHTPHRFWLPGGGYDRNITSVATLHKAVHYVHANRVRRGLVEQQEDWMWSSAADWLGLGAGPVPVDKETLPAL